MSQGKLSEGLEKLEKATEIYEEIGDTEGMIGSQLNQAQILLARGLYRQSLKVLAAVEENIDKESKSINPLVKAAQMRTLGNALRAVGDLDRSKTALEESMKIEGQSPQAKIATLVSLANTEQAIDDRLRAAKQIEPALTPFGCSSIKDMKDGETNPIQAKFYQKSENYYKQADSELEKIASAHIRLRVKLNEFSSQVMRGSLDNSSNREILQQLDRDIAAELE